MYMCSNMRTRVNFRWGDEGKKIVAF